MMVTLFLGGWTLPLAGLNRPADTIAMGIVHIIVFLAKVGLLMTMFIWVRWMWPRFRYDQLMDLGWRRFCRWRWPTLWARLSGCGRTLDLLAGMIVKRTKLNFLERLYLPAIVGGIRVTLRHFSKRK